MDFTVVMHDVDKHNESTIERRSFHGASFEIQQSGVLVVVDEDHTRVHFSPAYWIAVKEDELPDVSQSVS